MKTKESSKEPILEVEPEEKEQGVEEIFPTKKAVNWTNRQRTLLLCSRGATPRHRHVMMDLFNLMPHGKKEFKIEKKDLSDQLNELCTIHSCNNLLFFETRKKHDLFLWLGRSPNGPSAKFMVENIHTSDELKLTGNCLKGSRPVLSFDAEFDKQSHWKLIKEMLVNAFNVPKFHPKSKPFVDHIISFYISDNRIWFRNFQIFRSFEGKKVTNTELYEIGPRFVLNPIVILEGNLDGLVLYQNPEFKSPSQTGIKRKAALAKKYKDKVKKKKKREMYLHKFEVPKDEADEVFDDHDEEEDDDE